MENQKSARDMLAELNAESREIHKKMAEVLRAIEVENGPAPGEKVWRKSRQGNNPALLEIRALGMDAEVVSMDSGWGRLYLLKAPGAERLVSDGDFVQVEFRSNNRRSHYLNARMATAPHWTHFGKALEELAAAASSWLSAGGGSRERM